MCVYTNLKNCHLCSYFGSHSIDVIAQLKTILVKFLGKLLKQNCCCILERIVPVYGMVWRVRDTAEKALSFYILSFFFFRENKRPALP